MTELTDRLLKLPDRELGLAIGEIIQHLMVAHVFLDGESTAAQRIILPASGLIGRRYLHSTWAAWARSSSRNYRALHDELLALVEEYKRRNGGKTPRSLPTITALVSQPLNIPVGELAKFPDAYLPFKS